MSIERWRLLPGYGDCYFISDQGRLLSLKHRDPHIMSQNVDRTGYLSVQLSSGNRTYNLRVHRLVCETFHGAPPEGQEVRHLNGVKADCRARNLAWGTQSENALDRVRHGTHHQAAKTHCPQGHPYSVENTYRRPSKPNGRDCRTCHRDSGIRRALAAANVRSAAA